MDKRNYFLPPEIIAITIENAKKKAAMPVMHMALLGFLAGAFIAFASEGSNMAAFNLLAKPETFGLGKVLAGSIFGTGLMLVIVGGAELFTGNTMMIAGVLEKEVSVISMLKNWAFVYLGNFIGAVFVAFMMTHSGLFDSGAYMLGGMTIKIATYKVGLAFSQAFLLGVMCNWLVCLAVWMASGAKDITGKLLAVFFPIWLFITSGFEHSIANMYYIPAGILAKANPKLAEAAITLGAAPEKVDQLNWGSFLWSNLLPVTLGNIVGGGILVAGIYLFLYKRTLKGRTEENNENQLCSERRFRVENGSARPSFPVPGAILSDEGQNLYGRQFSWVDVQRRRKKLKPSD